MFWRSFKYIVILAAPLFLAACGEGYEMIRTDTIFPYGNKRTAGSGVAYVRASMLPEKGVNLESVKREQEPKVIEPPPVEPPAPIPVEEKGDKEVLENLETDMDKLFEEVQRK